MAFRLGAKQQVILSRGMLRDGLVCTWLRQARRPALAHDGVGLIRGAGTTRPSESWEPVALPFIGMQPSSFVRIDSH